MPQLMGTARRLFLQGLPSPGPDTWSGLLLPSAEGWLLGIHKWCLAKASFTVQRRLNPLGGDTKGWPHLWQEGDPPSTSSSHVDVMEAPPILRASPLKGSPSAASESQKLGQPGLGGQGTNLRARAVGVVQEQALCCQTHPAEQPRLIRKSLQVGVSLEASSKQHGRKFLVLPTSGVHACVCPSLNHWFTVVAPCTRACLHLGYHPIA